MNLLQITRKDHGVRCSQDQDLVQQLITARTPPTVCPLSNIKLKAINMEQHNIVDLLRQGLCVTINSDDPAYFSGYMTDNFEAVNNAHSLTEADLLLMRSRQALFHQVKNSD